MPHRVLLTPPLEFFCYQIVFRPKAKGELTRGSFHFLHLATKLWQSLFSTSLLNNKIVLMLKIDMNNQSEFEKQNKSQISETTFLLSNGEV